MQKNLTPGAFLAVVAIALYNNILSRFMLHSCRYLPSCSEYADVAVRKYGLVTGGLMALWRILRCNPLNSYGFDPVK